MVELLARVLHETEELGRIKASSDADYERFEQLVELRQLLVDTIAGQERGLTPGEQAAVKKIMSYDSVIMQHMERIKREAEEGIKHLGVVKKQKAAYDNYGAYDAIMFDKRN